MLPLTPARFDELVAEALDEIPDHLARFMDNVAVFADDNPSPEQIARGFLDLEPGEADDAGDLLGLYEGIALTDRGPMSYDGVMPDRITLFRDPLYRYCDDEQELRHEIVVTVVHEIGHHFGVDDGRLHELGWG